GAPTLRLRLLECRRELVFGLGQAIRGNRFAPGERGRVTLELRLGLGRGGLDLRRGALDGSGSSRSRIERAHERADGGVDRSLDGRVVPREHAAALRLRLGEAGEHLRGRIVETRLLDGPRLGYRLLEALRPVGGLLGRGLELLGAALLLAG